MRNTRRKRAAVNAGVNARMREAVADSLAHGNYFFNPDTVRFWNSRVEAGMFPNNTFVTSEDNFNRTAVFYTARKYDWKTHNVETIGDFQQFGSAEDAARFAKAYKE